MQRLKQRIADMTAPTKWLFYGDSITQGAQHTTGWRDYTQLFAERVRYELSRRQDIVINSAISGNNCQMLLDEYPWRCGQFLPHVVFIMVAMNDCCGTYATLLHQFKSNLAALVDRIAADGGIPVLQTTCAIVPHGQTKCEDAFPAFMDGVRETAEVKKCPLIDHHRYWQQQSPKRMWLWVSNPCHPNEKGHRVFANQIFRDLGVFDEAADTCRLFVP